MGCDNGFLRNNQLDKVICQLRFNSLFNIESHIGEFQESIRSDYPVGNKTSEFAEYPSPTFPVINSNYAFETEDGAWRINVTNSFISLTVDRHYTNWDEFRERLVAIVDSFTDHFEIDALTRVGVRYVNTLRRSKLHLDKDTKWEALLNESALGMARIFTNTTSLNSTAEFMIGAHQCRTITGYITFIDDMEQGFLIDNDVFTTNVTKKTDLIDTLNCLNSESYDVFKKIVREELLEMMKK